MVEQGDLPGVVQLGDMVDSQLPDIRYPAQRRVERRISVGETAGLKEMRTPRTRISPQAERGLGAGSGQPTGEDGQGFHIAAGDEIVERRRGFREQVENQLAHALDAKWRTWILASTMTTEIPGNGNPQFLFSWAELADLARPDRVPLPDTGRELANTAWRPERP